MIHLRRSSISVLLLRSEHPNPKYNILSSTFGQNLQSMARSVVEGFFCDGELLPDEVVPAAEPPFPPAPAPVVAAADDAFAAVVLFAFVDAAAAPDAPVAVLFLFEDMLLLLMLLLLFRYCFGSSSTPSNKH